LPQGHPDWRFFPLPQTLGPARVEARAPLPTQPSTPSTHHEEESPHAAQARDRPLPADGRRRRRAHPRLDQLSAADVRRRSGPGLGFWSLRKFDTRFLSGPYLLWAAGGLLLIAGLISFKVPMLVAGAALIGLGVWTRRLVAVPATLGPYLLWAGAAALLAAGYASATAFLMFVAAAFAGLGRYAWMREQERR
jgi:hypothetical protein